MAVISSPLPPLPPPPPPPPPSPPPLPPGACLAVLAGGLARRFGSAKLLAPLAGRPLLAWTLAAAAGAGDARRLLVCGPDPGRLGPALAGLSGWLLVPNPDPGRGLGSSLALAARRALALESSLLVVLLGDMPATPPALIAQLAELAYSSPLGAAAGTREGHPVHPVAFTRRHFPALAAARGESGGRGLLAALGPELPLWPVPALAARDVDTPADLARLEASWPPGPFLA